MSTVAFVPSQECFISCNEAWFLIDQFWAFNVLRVTHHCHVRQPQFCGCRTCSHSSSGPKGSHSRSCHNCSTVPSFLSSVYLPSALAGSLPFAAATNAATVVFNFLVVGVTAKVTKVVAVGAWAQVGARIRLALGMALVMGLAACALLMALQKPLWLLLADASPLVLSVAEVYFYLRVLGVPPQLLVMCTSGILQGYKVGTGNSTVYQGV